MKEKKYKNIDGVVWCCQKYINGIRHYYKQTIRYNSILFNSKLNLLTFIKLVYEWSNGNNINKSSLELNINKSTVAYWFSVFRKVVCNVVNNWCLGKIGGFSKIIELDECQIGRRKYHRGRPKNDIWVVGGIQRQSNPRICFLEIVDDRSMNTLTDLVCRNVDKNWLIITDEWKGYNGLIKNGFTHLKINHSKSFVDSTNPIIHTQNIENM